MKILNYNQFIIEVATPRDILYPKEHIEHENKIEPALLTFDEYFDELQKYAGKNIMKMVLIVIV